MIGMNDLEVKMPYKVKKVKGGYKVLRADTGKVVAGKTKPLTLKGAKGYMYHAGKAD